MLVRGHVNVQDFTDEAIADEAVLALARKVRYETREYETASRGFPGGFRATLTTGETIEGDFPFQKGGPDFPLTEAEVRAKFRANAELALSPAAIDALEEAVLALEEQTDLPAALEPLTIEEMAAV
jgi:2-methylcitrate dehydratase PrpD